MQVINPLIKKKKRTLMLPLLLWTLFDIDTIVVKFGRNFRYSFAPVTLTCGVLKSVNTQQFASSTTMQTPLCRPPTPTPHDQQKCVHFPIISAILSTPQMTWVFPSPINYHKNTNKLEIRHINIVYRQGNT